MHRTEQGRQRPSITERYISRAKAIEEYNKKTREQVALNREETMQNMTSGQIYTRVEADLDDAMEELSDAPTADVAHRARECMAEVIKVAKGSRNLQGGYVRILKHAAVVGSASTEILRSRADSNSGSDNGDASRQLKALKRELRLVRQEAKQAREEAAKAKEEAEALRNELIEIRGKRGNRTRSRIYYGDSSTNRPTDRQPSMTNKQESLLI